MNWKNLAVAEVHVLIRAMMFTVVGSVVARLATGEFLPAQTFLAIAGVLFIVSNAVFAFFKMRDDGTIEQALALEDRLEPGDNND